MYFNEPDSRYKRNTRQDLYQAFITKGETGGRFEVFFERAGFLGRFKCGVENELSFLHLLGRVNGMLLMLGNSLRHISRISGVVIAVGKVKQVNVVHLIIIP